ncbi:unnamed protein product [Oppiella nova]|uniref:Uncharacterized protein n=1 Tax=Oppiella nova TaxID=334625 RepID=A0A7R9M3E2_9ACAR|nr:unnamed protein product [Oppiella nova]CAG2169980.1 unnamed protein product [Oppiella nova]
MFEVIVTAFEAIDGVLPFQVRRKLFLVTRGLVNLQATYQSFVSCENVAQRDRREQKYHNMIVETTAHVVRALPHLPVDHPVDGNVRQLNVWNEYKQRSEEYFYNM